jgi:hypothetical protein
VLLFVRPAGQKWLFGFLLMFAVATQVWLVNVYRRDWIVQTNYYWQLYWRMPALQPDTAVLTFAYPSTLITHDLDATWALNVLYHFQIQDGSMPYRFVTPEQEIYFRPNTIFKETARNLVFHGNTSNNVAVLHQSETSCLRVLDTVYMYDPSSQDADGSAKLFPLSNPSRIIPDPAPAVSPNTDIFGPEPAHTWCYFFEKADLARQTKDWKTVIALYQQAKKGGFAPNTGMEFIPLIEAYAQTGDWQKAYDATLAAQKTNAGIKKALCTNWLRLSSLPSSDIKVIKEVKQALACTNF